MQPKVPKRKGAKAVSQATRAKRRKAEQFGPQAKLCRILPCCTRFKGARFRRLVRSTLIAIDIGWYGDESRVSDPHHLTARGMGGVKGKDEDTIPLSHKRHVELETIGREKFEAKYGVDLDEVLSTIRQARAEHARRTA